MTHSRFKVPSTPDQALGMIAALLASPTVQVIGESVMHFEMLSRQGTLEGNVKMVVHGKSRPREHAARLPRRGH